MYRNNKYYFFVSKALLTIWFLRITYDNSYNRFSPCRFAICFFFSSRWRHTRLQGDWSSDVCSSDLGQAFNRPRLDGRRVATEAVEPDRHPVVGAHDAAAGPVRLPGPALLSRYRCKAVVVMDSLHAG